jgi:hypothetical protein
MNDTDDQFVDGVRTVIEGMGVRKLWGDAVKSRRICILVAGLIRARKPE